MGWQERLREAAYVSPDGARIRFAYETVSRETKKRGTAHEFINVDGTYVQHAGRGGGRHALRCYFSGPDHDIEAEGFEAAVLMAGIGRLEHPLYGTLDVVPLGDITRRDDLKEAGNQSIVEVTFWETIRGIYPLNAPDTEGAVLAATAEVIQTLAQQFEDKADLSTEAARANVAARFTGNTDVANRELSQVAASDTDVLRSFNDQTRAIKAGIEVLIDTPLALASSAAEMVTAPARAAASIRARLDAYRDFAERIMDSLPGRPWDAFASIVGDSLRRRVTNDWHSSVVFVASAVAGSVLSVLNTQFVARPHAVTAAIEVLAQFSAAVDWFDRGFEAVGDLDSGEIDTGLMVESLRAAVSVVAGHLLSLAFTLGAERRITLDRDRTIVDLAAELYGRVDEELDFLIQTNDLSGDEIIELQRGRMIVYYPDHPPVDLSALPVLLPAEA